MTKKGIQEYRPAQEYREILNILNSEKLILDCGHHVTFNQMSGNSVVIQKSIELQITCSKCGC